MLSEWTEDGPVKIRDDGSGKETSVATSSQAIRVSRQVVPFEVLTERDGRLHSSSVVRSHEYS